MNTANIGRKPTPPPTVKQETTLAEILGESPVEGVKTSAPDAPIPTQQAEPEPEADAPHGRDEVGRTIPNAELGALFTRRGELRELMQAVSNLKIKVTRAAGSDPLYRLIHGQQFAIDCQNLFSALKFALPYAVCPYCGGESVGNRCNACKGSGWVNKIEFKATPKELVA